MPFHYLGSDEMAKAFELQAEKVEVAGPKFSPNQNQSIAEIAVLDYYGKELSPADYDRRDRSIQIKFTDNAGNRVRVVQGFWPQQVPMNRVDADVYVFCTMRANVNEVSLNGWLTKVLLEECPIGDWFGKPCYEAETDYLIDMPVEFEFREKCFHERWGKVWDYFRNGWECFGCGRYIPSRYVSELIEREKNEEGLER